tara:strand:+ start:234 stop:872 length:639 start_codon:yes stop_codon:yes gene_type:complete
MAIFHKEDKNNTISGIGANLRGDISRIDSSTGFGNLNTAKQMNPLEEARLASFGTNNSFQNDGAGIMQRAEQYGKSIAFGGQQAQQFFARQYGRPVTPPNSNPQNFNDAPLAMDPSMIIKAVGAFKESNQKDRELGDAVNKHRDMNSGINFNGSPDNEPGLLGAINKQSKMVSDHMQGKKNYGAETRKLKKKDYAKHPEVIAHNEHAERTNK